jgi:hypothetical protein
MQLHYLFLQNAPISNFCVIYATFSYKYPDQAIFCYADVLFLHDFLFKFHALASLFSIGRVRYLYVLIRQTVLKKPLIVYTLSIQKNACANVDL